MGPTWGEPVSGHYRGVPGPRFLDLHFRDRLMSERCIQNLAFAPVLRASCFLQTACSVK